LNKGRGGKLDIVFLTRRSSLFKKLEKVLNSYEDQLFFELAPTGDVLKEKLKRKSYDFVILDIDHPHASEALILKPLVPDVPFILTGRGKDSRDIVKLLEEGATDYFLVSDFLRLPMIIRRCQQEKAQEKQMKRLYELFVETEDRHRQIVESSGDGIIVLSGPQIVFANKRFCEITGYLPGEILGANIEHLFVNPKDNSLFPSSKGSSLKEFIVKKKDGKAIWVEVSTSPMNWQGNESLLVLVRDITERKLSEKRMRALYKVGIEMTSYLDPSLLLRKAISHLRKALDAHYIVAFVDDDEIGSFSEAMDEKGNQIALFLSEKEMRSLLKDSSSPLFLNGKEGSVRASSVFGLSKIRTLISIPIKFRRKVFGSLVLLDRRKNPFDKESIELVSTLSSQLGVALQNTKLFSRLNEAIHNLERSYENTLISLVSALDFREHETNYHSMRVARYAVYLGEKIKLGSEELRFLYWGGLLHDIGKIGVSDSILLKPGKLDLREWQEMKKHNEIGHKIIEKIDFLGRAKEVVLYHHERWDGKGYPFGLKGDEIPILARVFAVVDALDAITSDRPYRKARTFKEAYDEIRSCSGTQFDPMIVQAFLAIEPLEWMKIKEQVESEGSKKVYSFTPL